jgi:hypothetical protein
MTHDEPARGLRTGPGSNFRVSRRHLLRAGAVAVPAVVLGAGATRANVTLAKPGPHTGAAGQAPAAPPPVTGPVLDFC